MNYRWMLFGLAAALLGIGAWYLGRPIAPRVEPRVDQARAVESSPSEPAIKHETPKVIDVIDLARAYEPVRDVEPMTPNEIQAASFIEAQYAPPRIPYAMEFEDRMIEIMGYAISTGPSTWLPERIDIMPRLVK